jgi:leucyl aminopeptidase
VVGLIPACENMPDGRAVKPGDVVTSMSGQTIEILNTDAEGRLILCDALTYAERFKPRAVVDIATLTGACVIALGGCAAACLPGRCPGAGAAGRRRAGPGPVLAHAAGRRIRRRAQVQLCRHGQCGGRAGGAITAAKFLQKFTAKMPWAHLDIAKGHRAARGAVAGLERPSRCASQGRISTRDALCLAAAVPGWSSRARAGCCAAAAPEAGAAVSLEQMQEQVIHRVMQRVDLSLERRLREAIATLVLEHTRNLGPLLREEIELVVRQAVTEAVAQELPARPGASQVDHP